MGYGTQNQAAGEEPANASSSNSAAVPASSSTHQMPMDEEVALVQGRRGYWQPMRDFYDRNFGLFLVFSAQTFGSVVSLRPDQFSRLTTYLRYTYVANLVVVDEYSGETVDFQRRL
jgi:hypothetical protein